MINKLKSIYKRRRVIIFGKKYVFKLYFSKNDKALHETTVKELISHNQFWSNLNPIFYTLSVRTPIISITKAKKIQTFEPTTLKQAEQLCFQMIAMLSDIIRDQSLASLINPNGIIALRSLPANLSTDIDHLLKNFLVPMTGAHTDLTIYNTLRAEGKTYIIDWETFRDQGSAYEDIIRLISTAARSSATPGPDIESLALNATFRNVTNEIGLSLREALLLYAVIQAGAEAETISMRDVHNNLIKRVLNTNRCNS